MPDSADEIVARLQKEAALQEQGLHGGDDVAGLLEEAADLITRLTAPAGERDEVIEMCAGAIEKLLDCAYQQQPNARDALEAIRALKSQPATPAGEAHKDRSSTPKKA